VAANSPLIKSFLRMPSSSPRAISKCIPTREIRVSNVTKVEGRKRSQRPRQADSHVNDRQSGSLLLLRELHQVREHVPRHARWIRQRRRTETDLSSNPYHHQTVLGDNIVIRTSLLKGTDKWGKPALEIFDAFRPNWLPQTGEASVKGPPPE
jgi:hypothetical protein